MKRSSLQKTAPSKAGSLAGAFWDYRRWDWPTIALILGLKALVLTFGVQAVASLTTAHAGWLEIWNQWDAMHYLRLAEQG